jgi:hypothetical protein
LKVGNIEATGPAGSDTSVGFHQKVNKNHALQNVQELDECYNGESVMKKAIVPVLLALTVMINAAGRTEAAPFTAATFPGLNDIHDQSAETVVDANGVPLPPTTQVKPGDFLIGVYQVENIKSFNGQNNFLGNPTFSIGTAVTLFKIDSLTPNGTVGGIAVSKYGFVAPTAAEWTSITTANGTPVAAPTGTIITWYNNPTNSNPTTPATLKDALAAAVSGGPANLAWNLGFTGAPNPADPVAPLNPTANAALGEGWQVTAPTSLADLNAIITAGFNPGYKGGLSVITTGPVGIPLFPTTDFAGTTFNGTPPQLLVEGSINAFSSHVTLGAGDFNDIFINTVPEPTSFVLLSVGSCLMLASSMRRRLKKTVA